MTSPIGPTGYQPGGLARPGNFQPFAFQSGPSVQQFGYMNVTTYAQWGNFPTVRNTFLESSACFVRAAFYDINGVAFAPLTVQWRLDDLVSGFNIVPWTPISPGLVVNYAVTSGNNNMITLTRAWEARQVLIQVTDGYGDINMQRTLYYLVKILGGLNAGGDGFQGDVSFQPVDSFQTPNPGF